MIIGGKPSITEVSGPVSLGDLFPPAPQQRLQSIGSRRVEESGTTEQLHFHFSLSCTGEGNGNPLQYSCLENPRDDGAWWAAVYGVTQSRTQLKCESEQTLGVGDDREALRAAIHGVRVHREDDTVQV